MEMRKSRIVEIKKRSYRYVGREHTKNGWVDVVDCDGDGNQDGLKDAGVKTMRSYIDDEEMEMNNDDDKCRKYVKSHRFTRTIWSTHSTSNMLDEFCHTLIQFHHDCNRCVLFSVSRDYMMYAAIVCIKYYAK